MDSLAETEDDYEIALGQKSQRDAQLSWTLMFVVVSVVCSWMLGTMGLSLAWLLLLLALVIAVWKTSLLRLVEAAVNYETLRIRRKRALSNDETAEWLNFLLNRWWVFSSPSLFTILKERLEPLLNEAKPSFVENLELRQFTMGDQTPYVKAVRVFDVNQGKHIPLSARSLQQPPSGLALRVHHQVALEADVCLDSDDFRMVMRTRLFGKGVGMDLDLALEKLHISGKMYATLTLNMEAPFPHVTHLNLTFKEQPEVWFSIRVLKAVQMMEVPVLKTWIHALVMDAVVTSLVDPGKLDLNLTSHNRPTAGQDTGDRVAQGVLTVTLSAVQPGHAPQDAQWLVLTLGEQHQKTSHLSACWQESPSFLINSLQTDILAVKLKSKRLIRSVTLARFELQLSDYNLDSVHIVETALPKKQAPSYSSNIPSIAVRLEYTALPPILLEQPAGWPVPEATVGGILPVSGVMFVYVHGAEDLASGDQSQCNPYCMLFSDQKKVKTTHYLHGTTHPQWESRAQFLVSDFTKVSLSFVVCSWSPNKMADTDLLGLAVLRMHQSENWLVHQRLQLNGNTCSAAITVSVVFCPVASVAQSELCSHNGFSSLDADDDGHLSYNKVKRNSITVVQEPKILLTHRDQDTSASDVSSQLSSAMGLMEVIIIRAHDLVSKDMNGFSDPYYELKVNGECKYKSSIKKKTLSPIWDETAIMGLPKAGELLEVVLWDHDTYGVKGFLGSTTLTLEDIRRVSNFDVSHSCQLQGVRTGVIEIKVKVISEENESQSYQPSNNSSSNSPLLPNRREPDSVCRHTSGERSKLLLNAGDIPPTAPPCTVAFGYKHLPEGDLLHAPLTNGVNNGNVSPTQSSSSSLHSLQRMTVTELHDSRQLPVTVPGLPSTSAGSDGQHSHHTSLIPSPSGQFKKNVPEYSSFRIMKQKMKRGFKLRRFKSEVSVHEEKSGEINGKPNKTTALSIEPSGGGESDATELLQMEGLSHAVSQPNILHIKQPSLHLKLKRPTDLKASARVRPDKYFGVEGKVIQAQGLHVAHVAQLYCHIKLQSATSPDKPTRVGSSAVGKTLAKSRLLPAMPNPRFDLSFQLDNPENVPRQAALVFEIRSSVKEVVAACRITLQDMLSAASPDTNEVRTWLALNNGASLEVEIAHSRELKKQSRKIFRSWSVHRLGKI